jgi:hypothetical protein
MFWCLASVNYELQPPLLISVMLLFEEQVCQSWVEVMVLLVVHVLEIAHTLALHTQPLLHNFATLVAHDFFISCFLSLLQNIVTSLEISHFSSRLLKTTIHNDVTIGSNYHYCLHGNHKFCHFLEQWGPFRVHT